MLKRDGKRSFAAIGNPGLQPVSGIDLAKPGTPHDFHMDKYVSIFAFTHKKTIPFQTVEPFYRYRLIVSRRRCQHVMFMIAIASMVIRIVFAAFQIYRENLYGLPTAIAFGKCTFQPSAFWKGSPTMIAQDRKMDEDVTIAIIGYEESVSACAIEPFDDPRCMRQRFPRRALMGSIVRYALRRSFKSHCVTFRCHASSPTTAII